MSFVIKRNNDRAWKGHTLCNDQRRRSLQWPFRAFGKKFHLVFVHLARRQLKARKRLVDSWRGAVGEGNLDQPWVLSLIGTPV